MSKADDAKYLLESVGQVARLAREAKVSSLTEFTSATRVEPLTLIESNIENMDPDMRQAILQTTLSIYCGHYMQAVDLSASVGNIRVLNILDKLSTDRDPLLAAGSGWANLHERFGNENLSLDDISVMSAGLENKNEDRYVNMAVGKTLSLSVKVDDKQIPFTSTVRLIPQVLSTQNVVDTLALNSKDNSLRGRWHRWRAGELSLADYVFALDMIEADKKGLLNDKHGLYKAKRDRKGRGIISAILSGEASVNTVSAISVITHSTSKKLEVAMRGKLSRFRDREAYFEDTNSMMLVVVDPQLETLTLYQRGISDIGDYSFKDIEKNGTNPNGVDINSVLKAYRAGQSPGL